MTSFVRDAHAVLLPVAGELSVEPWLRALLERGTVAVLSGETRDEYVARAMSAKRRASESAGSISAFVADVERVVDGPVLIAVDQEPWGIARLHDLVPPFPAPRQLPRMPNEEIKSLAAAVASAARRMGVNMFLAPVLDVLTGANPWLEGRTLSLDAAEVGRISAAVVAGVQSVGVVAVAKHFPGFPILPLDPALYDTRLPSHESTDSDLVPFKRVISAGVKAIMTGPAIVQAIDPLQPASTSVRTMNVLRRQLAFDGLIVSDDLDAPSTTTGRSLTDTVFASLEAGADLLLLPGGPEVLDIAQSVAVRAEEDPAFGMRVVEAAQRVRGTAAVASGAFPRT